MIGPLVVYTDRALVEQLHELCDALANWQEEIAAEEIEPGYQEAIAADLLDALSAVVRAIHAMQTPRSERDDL